MISQWVPLDVSYNLLDPARVVINSSIRRRHLEQLAGEGGATLVHYNGVKATFIDVCLYLSFQITCRRQQNWSALGNLPTEPHLRPKGTPRQVTVGSLSHLGAYRPLQVGLGRSGDSACYVHDSSILLQSSKFPIIIIITIMTYASRVQYFNVRITSGNHSISKYVELFRSQESALAWSQTTAICTSLADAAHWTPWFV
jgi:hypothetical protein